MSIIHNLMSTNIQNQLQRTEKRRNNSLEKLSSGLRINQAADDVAGLAISENMRAQIRGLDQASRNIQDGISFVQTADQGLGQILSPALQRMRELTIHAGDGTLTNEDRQKIQDEINSLKDNIDDIAHNTHFNGIHMLNTEDASDNGNSAISSSTNSTDYTNILAVPPVNSSGQFLFSTNLGYPTTTADDNQTLVYGTGGTSWPQINVDGISTRLSTLSHTATTESGGVYSTAFTTTNNITITQSVQIVQDKYEIKYAAQNNDSVVHDIGIQFHIDTKLGSDDAAPFIVNNTTIQNPTEFLGASIPDSFTVYNQTTTSNGNPLIQAEGVLRGPGILVDPDRFGIGQYSQVSNWTWTPSGTVGDSGYSIWWNPRTLASGDTLTVNTFYGLSIPPTIATPTPIQNEEEKTPISDIGGHLLIQVGANSNQTLSVPTVNSDAKHIGLQDVEVMSTDDIDHALVSIDHAISKVSDWRSQYGARQNALESQSENVNNANLLTTAAESRIRDANIAKEMITYVKENMLSQAVQAIAVKANTQSQTILQLLQ